MHDLRDLARQGEACILRDEPSAVLVYHLDPALRMPVDDDVRALWHAHADRKRRRP
jgi:hypothetical protein